MTAPPLSLYVHLPWCVQKCPYCDFNSHALRSTLPQQEYVDALLVDLDRELARSGSRKIETVFFGGGTPSLIDANQLDRVLERLRISDRLSEVAEITLEANPGASDAQRFAAYADIGINRLSIGVQSFDDHCLKSIGRIHDGEQAMQALQLARDNGFRRINLDLMYGLPGQTREQALHDVQQALAFDPGHISQYQLTLEPGTVFYKRPPLLPDDESIWSMMQASQQVFIDNGYHRYEVSALSRPGQQSRHNLNYWQFGDYLGIGAGAHGKLTLGNKVFRSGRVKPPTLYMAAPDSPPQPVATDSLAFEFMLNALRLTAGFDLALFESRTGLPVTAIQTQLDQAISRKMIRIADRIVRPTRLGYRFLNDLQSIFLPPTAATETP